MSFEYSAENHDWDLTLHAAAELIGAGLEADKTPPKGSLTPGFSYFTGGMILAFAAVESFSASIAFMMASNESFSGFDFVGYKKARGFWARMQLLMDAAEIKVDKDKGLFNDLGRMQRWRNLVVHASPYGIGPTLIDDPSKAPLVLNQKYKHLEYTKMATATNAEGFYTTALVFIKLVESRTKLSPRATASYTNVG